MRLFMACKNPDSLLVNQTVRISYNLFVSSPLCSCNPDTHPVLIVSRGLFFSYPSGRNNDLAKAAILVFDLLSAELISLVEGVGFEPT